MVIIKLSPGETIIVGFVESDGEITVAFRETEITVYANLPDASNREGIIYREVFEEPLEKEVLSPVDILDESR